MDPKIHAIATMFIDDLLAHTAGYAFSSMERDAYIAQVEQAIQRAAEEEMAAIRDYITEQMV